MNNRQSGRRRGRNNNNSNNNRQSSGGRGGMDQANRIDSRARGNGAQMIEKFRNMARDAQLAGDRVQTEYYLQFADHYFRVVSDFRQRQEERSQGQDRPHERQREVRGVEDFDGHDDTDEMDRDDNDNQADSKDHRSDNRSDNRNDNRGERQGRDRQHGDDDNRAPRQPARAKNPRNRDSESPSDGVKETKGSSDDAVAAEAPAPRSPRRPTRAPRTPRIAEPGEATGIDSAALPPAIGRPTNGKTAEAEAAGDEAPAPKVRRPRRTVAKRDEGSEAAE